MYFLLGISIAFALLLVINMLSAVFASALWSAVARPVSTLSARTQAAVIFGLRVFPVAAALLFVFAFIIPAYLIYEPAASGEIVSWKLLLVVIASLLSVAVAVFRVLRTWIATRRLISGWMHAARPLPVPGLNVPAFSIKHPFPVVAVVGIFRPRIFLAEKVLDSLDTGEFTAAIAHEFGHLDAYDNLKRTILRVCRDLVVLPIGGRLDQAWAHNAESVADEYAASKSKAAALDLASALVKIARIAPVYATPVMPSGAFLLEEPNADVTTRVRHLVEISEGQDSRVRSAPQRFFPTTWVACLALIVVVGLPLADERLLVMTHTAVEYFVHALQ
ncbi:MAG: M48 family metalloprotease [Acidobacteriota bacterium]